MNLRSHHDCSLYALYLQSVLVAVVQITVVKLVLLCLWFMN